MKKSTSSRNYPTLRMCFFGFLETRERGQGPLSLQEFFVRCAEDNEFKASYAPFLDLEYIEDEELQKPTNR